MTVPRYSDSEVLALHDRVRALSTELQAVLDELLERVMVAIQEGNSEDAVVAIEQIKSIRDTDSGGDTVAAAEAAVAAGGDVDSGSGAAGQGDPGPVEPDERGSDGGSDIRGTS